MRIKCSVFIFVMSDVDVECGQNEAEEAITGSQDSKHKINRKQKKNRKRKESKRPCGVLSAPHSTSFQKLFFSVCCGCR